jgi:hypothetical protein
MITLCQLSEPNLDFGRIRDWTGRMPIDIRMTDPRMRWSIHCEYSAFALWLQALQVIRYALMRGFLAPNRVSAAFAQLMVRPFAQLFALDFAKAQPGSYPPAFFPARSALPDHLTFREGLLCISPRLAKNSSLIAPEQEKHCA